MPKKTYPCCPTCGWPADDDGPYCCGATCEQHPGHSPRACDSFRNNHFDSTVARIAGNVAGQAMKGHDWSDGKDAYLRLAIHCVAIARAIVAECQRTEPAAPLEAKTGVFSLQKLRTWLERERARPLYEQAGADKLFSGDDVAVYFAKLDLALSLLTEQEAELATLRAEHQHNEVAATEAIDALVRERDRLERVVAAAEKALRGIVMTGNAITIKGYAEQAFAILRASHAEQETSR